MIADALKTSFLTYLAHLGLYDYLALFWFTVSFCCIILLAIAIVKRSASFSLLLIVLSLLFFCFAPFLIKNKLNTLTRTTHSEILSTKKLTFSETLIVEASISNRSSNDFSVCLLQVMIFKSPIEEGMSAYLSKLKPIAYQSILLTQSLPKDTLSEHRIIFDNFDYEGETVANIITECY